MVVPQRELCVRGRALWLSGWQTMRRGVRSLRTMRNEFRSRLLLRAGWFGRGMGRVAFLAVLVLGPSLAGARVVSLYPSCDEVASTPLLAAVRSQSTTGLADAYCRIDDAVRQLGPGDVLLVKKGEHRLNTVHTVNFKGRQGAPVTMRGEEGAVFVGTFDAATNHTRFKPDDYTGLKFRGQWGVIENLVFRRIGGGLDMVASHITVRNVRVEAYSNYAFIVNRSSDVVFDGLHASGSHFEHGVYLTDANRDILIRNSVFEDTAINGVHINGKDIRGVLIERSVFRRNSRDWGACITQMRGARDITVRNNLFYNNFGHIFTAGGPGLRVENNTVYQTPNGRPGQVFVVIASAKGWVVRNNVFATNTHAFDLKSPQMLNGADINGNVYASAASEPASFYARYGMESAGIVNANVLFAVTPGQFVETLEELRLARNSPGASGAPLLKDTPRDFEGNPRRQGGAYGAFAEAVSWDNGL